MTLEEYQKVLEEKRKALQALKTSEERKVDAKEFETMHQLSSKKGNDDVFIKLVRLLWKLFAGHSFMKLKNAANHMWCLFFKGSDKDKRREAAEKDEKAKKVNYLNLTFCSSHMICKPFLLCGAYQIDFLVELFNNTHLIMGT